MMIMIIWFWFIIQKVNIWCNSIETHLKMDRRGLPKYVVESYNKCWNAVIWTWKERTTSLIIWFYVLYNRMYVQWIQNCKTKLKWTSITTKGQQDFRQNKLNGKQIKQTEQNILITYLIPSSQSVSYVACF